MTRRNPRIFLLSLSALALALTFGLGNFRPVVAQGASLEVSPQAGSVRVDEKVVVDLLIDTTAAVNAFDIEFHYDGALLTLQKWVSGGFLSNLAVVTKTDTPGYFRLVCTQLATPAVTGTGTLVQLTFYGQAVGQSDLNLTKAEFSDSTGNKTIANVVNAMIVVNAAAQNPTATATATQPAPPTQVNATTPIQVSPTVSQPSAYPGQLPTSLPQPTATPAANTGYPAQTTPPAHPAANDPDTFPGGPPASPTLLVANPGETSFPPSGQFTNEVTAQAPNFAVPLRNTDPASIWKPGQQTALTLPWVILGVEVILLAVLAWLLFRRKR